MPPVTATATDTVKKVLDRANPNTLADALAKTDLGTMLTPLRRAFTGLAAAAAQDLTLIDATGETTGVANPNRLALLTPTTLRVTAGAAAAGARLLTDGGGAASATVALISDDGKTVTFEAAVTAFIIEYVPRAGTDLTTAFTPTT